MFRLVQLLVRQAEHLIDVTWRFQERHDTDTERDRSPQFQHPGPQGALPVFSAASRPSSDAVSISSTANSSPPVRDRNVGLADMSVQHLTHPAQDGIPEHMPALVIDLLEVIDVDEDQVRG